MKLDLANKNLKKLDKVLLKNLIDSIQFNEDEYDVANKECFVKTILLDNNHLSKLENLDKFVNLKHISLANNHLIEIRLISKLANLQFVNLLNNSLNNLDGFKELKNLMWLNLSGNQIKCLDSLKSNTRLQYIDASENSISYLSDLSSLTELKTLNLNGNEISTLKQVPNCLPKSLENLFISYNAIEDLNEMSFLTCLNQLENLCVDSNPCTSYSNYEIMFDYRPFIINWCLTLNILDGTSVNQKEYLKAEWLYSQGKGRHFRSGQSLPLIDYLIKTCPVNYTQSTDDDVRLSKILEKKNIYQTSSNHNYDNYQDLFKANSKVATHLLASQPNSVNKNHQKVANNNIYVSNSNKIIEEKKDPNIESDDQEINYKKFNLLNNLCFSSSDSVNQDQDQPQIQRIDHKTNFEAKISGKAANSNLNSISASKMETLSTDLHDMNKSRYDEYDSRPIKPLDPNLLNEKLSEYTEMSNEEMMLLKQRAAQHQRSKTTETVVGHSISRSHHQSFRLKQPSKLPNRQLSFNSNEQLNSPKSHLNFINNTKTKLTSSPSTAVNNNEKASNSNANRFKKRSKTQDDLKINQKTYSPAKQYQQIKSVYSKNHYTPLKGAKSSVNSATSVKQDSQQNLSKKATNNSNTPITNRQKNEIKENQKKDSIKVSTESDENEIEIENNKIISDNNLASRFNDESSKLIDESSSLLFNVSITKPHHSPIDAENQMKRRQELRLIRERNLMEIKNQRVREEQKKRDETMLSLIENYQKNHQTDPSRFLTFQDRQAIKIQAAWRGYLTRNSKIVQQKMSSLKFKKLLKVANDLKENLEQLKLDQKSLIQLNQEQNFTIVSLLKNFSTTTDHDIPDSLDFDDIRNKIQPINMNKHSPRKSLIYEENANLKLEVNRLKEKCKILEEKLSKKNDSSINETKATADNISSLKSFQMALDQMDLDGELTIKSNVQNLTSIYPPLNVRLQKLNEKSVAVKWNHNPKNVFAQLEGYNIYINDELCATMKPTDMIAAINGIQEVGEYRIYLRAVLNELESTKSNQVITRVRKKEPLNDVADERANSNNETTESDSNIPKTTDSESGGLPSSISKNNNDILKSNSNNTSNCNTDESSAENEMNQIYNKAKLSDIAATSSKKSINTSQHSPQSKNQSNQAQSHRVDVASRLAKTFANMQPMESTKGYSVLNENEKNCLLKASDSSSVESSSMIPSDYKPFSSSNQLEAKQFVSSYSFSVEDSNLNTNHYQELLKKYNNQEKHDQSKLAPNMLTLSKTGKPPVSPPRAPSPNTETNKPSGHKKTKSFDSNNKYVKEPVPNHKIAEEDESEENSQSSKPTLSSQHLADIANNVIFSVSEPNLSNNLLKTSSTGSNVSNGGRHSFVRQSFSFDENEDDEEDDVHGQIKMNANSEGQNIRI